MTDELKTAIDVLDSAPPDGSKAKPLAVGSHVVYNGSDYRFPGEVIAAGERGAVVKAFGDSDGNYTGMRHGFFRGDLEPYTLGERGPFPPLVIFPDDNPITKIRAYLKRYGGREYAKASQAVAFLEKLLAAGEEVARIRQAELEPTHDYYPSTTRKGYCAVCGNVADHPNHTKC